MAHPLAIWTAAAATIVGVKMVRREVRRIRRQIEKDRLDRIDRDPGVALTRDPVSGVYRTDRSQREAS